VSRSLDRSGVKQNLEDWSNETVQLVVNAFVDEKFPTVIALNKIDHNDSSKVRSPACACIFCFSMKPSLQLLTYESEHSQNI
jgi:ribosome-binding ATPase YchF (GTP1/OBG family)